MTCSAVKPSGTGTSPERTASCAAARVGELVRPPESRPAAAPGANPSSFEKPSASEKPVSAITTASAKYLAPSWRNTLKKLGPAWRPTEKMNSTKPRDWTVGLKLEAEVAEDEPDEQHAGDRSDLESPIFVLPTR